MSTMLRPVKRQPALGEQVYHALQDLLRSGDIAAGQPLQEVLLAGQLGVSRTPVREAMTRLESEGRLVSDGRSFVIPALTLADVDDIYEIRFLVEPAALRSVAATPIDPAARARLETCLASATEAHAVGDVTRFRDSVGRFRSTWLALVPNPRLVRIVEQYADHMHHMRALTQGDAKVRAIVLAGNRRIAAALARGDAERAAAASRENLRQAHRAFVVAAGLGDVQTRIRTRNAANASARTTAHARKIA